jgi:hypothetical protein
MMHNDLGTLFLLGLLGGFALLEPELEGKLFFFRGHARRGLRGRGNVILLLVLLLLVFLVLGLPLIVIDHHGYAVLILDLFHQLL